MNNDYAALAIVQTQKVHTLSGGLFEQPSTGIGQPIRTEGFDL